MLYYATFCRSTQISHIITISNHDAYPRSNGIEITMAEGQMANGHHQRANLHQQTSIMLESQEFHMHQPDSSA
jgi:hypothetical protein